MRRLHPRSAVARIASAMVQGAFFGFFVGTAGAGMLGLPGLVVPLLGPVGALLGGAYATARYLRFRYEIQGKTLAVESGVFARQSREIPLGRIQNVDIRQGILNRLLGLSVVKFETAGGSATEATLDAVDAAEADRLRRLVQDHDRQPASVSDDATKAATEDGAVGGTEQHAGSGPTESGIAPELLFAFTWRELLTYALVSVRPAAPVLTLVGLPIGSDLVVQVLRFNMGLLGTEGPLGIRLLREMATPRLLVLTLITFVQFLLVALVVSVVLTVVEYYEFTLTLEDDDLRYERGLVRRYSGNIPLDKVQTVTIRENVLMRQFGFATLIVETAGYGPQSQQSTQGVAVPMAPRGEVYELARDIEPFGDLDFERAPTRARQRYAFRFGFVAALGSVVAYAVDTFVFETGFWWLSLGLFIAVVPAAHLRWIHRGYDLDDSALATRAGFWRRTTRIVPYYRIQTVFVRRTVFQRRRRLGTVTADTASTSSLMGGNPTVFDLDDEDAATLRSELRARLRTDLLGRNVSRNGTIDIDERPTDTADETELPDE